jgi:hypothetical protein
MGRESPDRLLGFEDKTITGRLRPVKGFITPRTLDEVIDEGYTEGDPIWVIEELPTSPK